LMALVSGVDCYCLGSLNWVVHWVHHWARGLMGGTVGL
jgi:hypothetical protein